MKVRTLIAFLFLALPCFAHHTAVVVNKENALDNVSSAYLARIVRGEIKKWPDGTSIVLVLHRDTGEDESLARLNKMSAAEWGAFLTAHRDSIHLLDSDADVLKIVQSELARSESLKFGRWTTA